MRSLRLLLSLDLWRREEEWRLLLSRDDLLCFLLLRLRLSSSESDSESDCDAELLSEELSLSYLFFSLEERADFFEDEDLSFESLCLSPDFALLVPALADSPVPEEGEADPGEDDPEPVVPSCFFKNPKRELDFGLATGSSSLMRFLHS